MPKRTKTCMSIVGRAGLVVILSGIMTACNLGQQAPSEPISNTPQVVMPLDIPTASPTPLIQVPPTATPLPELLPAETLGPITIDGTTHRTLEPVTVRVTRGKSVSNVTCTWALQDTGGQPTPLGTPTTTQLDENTYSDVYTFTPQAAGTYVVSCTGVALTISGQRPVSAVSTPFAVEAKG